MDANEGIGQEKLSEANGVRQSYHAPELVRLGQIETLVQLGCAPGNDSCGVGGNCASS